MRRYWTELLTAATLGVLLIFCLACVGGGGGGGGGGGSQGSASVLGTNTIAYHAAISSSSDSSPCVTCHGNMTDRQTLNPNYPEFHYLKLNPTNGILRNWNCTNCHGATDIVSLSMSGANLRKQVDVERVCYPCHGGASSPYTRLYE